MVRGFLVFSHPLLRVFQCFKLLFQLIDFFFTWELNKILFPVPSIYSPPVLFNISFSQKPLCCLFRLSGSSTRKYKGGKKKKKRRSFWKSRSICSVAFISMRTEPALSCFSFLLQQAGARYRGAAEWQKYHYADLERTINAIMWARHKKTGQPRSEKQKYLAERKEQSENIYSGFYPTTIQY